MELITIEARDLEDAWFQCIYNIIDKGRKYVVEQGSFVGQTRLEFDAIMIRIKHPYSEPYDTMLPQIPAGLNIPNPVENGYIEQYMSYLMTDFREDNEDYSYGERLVAGSVLYDRKHFDYCDMYGGEVNQINKIIALLRETPNTNQAVLQVAQPGDCLLKDPPCLRSLHCKIIDGKLVFYPYFRSNDLWGGFPANLAGIAVLQKYMADEIGVPIGEMIYFSSGLHIYGYVEELAKVRKGV